jgi:hypothetical protein
METKTELVDLSDSKVWLHRCMPEINRILEALKEANVPHVIGDNVENLNLIHGVVSSIRNRQEHVKTYLINVIGIELEVKRFVALAKSRYKDAIGPAFVQYSELVNAARSYEEKENRVRSYVPQISELENWESIKDQISSLKEAVTLAYEDLSKASMTASLQVNVIRQQVLTGDIKVRIGNFGTSELVKENLLNSEEKFLTNKLPGDGQKSGFFDL